MAKKKNLQIEYKPFTLGMLESFQDKERPLLESVVDSINGLPLAEVDSMTRMRAGFAVLRFFTTEMQDLNPDLLSNMSSDGDS